MHLKGLRRIMLHYAMSPGAGLGVAHPAFRCVPARLGGADVDATHKRRNTDKQQSSAPRSKWSGFKAKCSLPFLRHRTLGLDDTERLIERPKERVRPGAIGAMCAYADIVTRAEGSEGLADFLRRQQAKSVTARSVSSPGRWSIFARSVGVQNLF